MKPLGLTANKLAVEPHVPAARIGEMVHERRQITAEIAVGLARYLHPILGFGKSDLRKRNYK